MVWVRELQSAALTKEVVISEHDKGSTIPTILGGTFVGNLNNN